MPTYVSLIRGINVAGHKQIKMADLKKVYDSLGYANVATYVQSGNIAFETESADRQRVTAEQEMAIKKRFGFDVPVLVLTPADLQKVVDYNPFAGARSADQTKLLVTFLKDEPTPQAVDALRATPKLSDEFVVTGKIVYLYCPGGYGRSKLSNTFLESKLKVIGTTRNWRTILTLIDLAAGRPG